MGQNTEKKSSRRKIAAIIVTIVVIASMCIMGTYAFTPNNLVTKAVTLLTSGDTPTVSKVVGHYDVFGSSHDVYVEYANPNQNGDKPVYVRVKLSESLTLNGKTPITNETTAGREQLAQYRTLTMGNATTKTYLKANSASYDKTSPNAQKTLISGVAKDNSGATYTLGTTDIDTIPSCGTPQPMANYIAWPYDANVIAGVNTTYTQFSYVGWVADTDGWYYWSQPLTSTKNTTGLLVDAVNMTPAASNYGYNYKMEVTFEAVDSTDLKVITNSVTTLTEAGEIDGVTLPANSTLDNRGMITRGGRTLLKIISDTDYAIDISKMRYAAGPDTTTRRMYQEAYTALGYTDFDNQTKTDLGLTSGIDNMALLRYAEIKAAQTAAASEKTDVLLSKNGADTITNMDDTLKTYLINEYDGNHDGNLTQYEARAIFAIHLDCKSEKYADHAAVNTLAGLEPEYFPNLKVLQIKNSALQTINVPSSTELYYLPPTVQASHFLALENLVVLDLSMTEGDGLLTTPAQGPGSEELLDFSTCDKLKVLVFDGQNSDDFKLIPSNDHSIGMSDTGAAVPTHVRVCSLANTNVDPIATLPFASTLEYFNVAMKPDAPNNLFYFENLPTLQVLRYLNTSSCSNFNPAPTNATSADLSGLAKLCYLNLEKTNSNSLIITMPANFPANPYDFPTLNEGWLEGIDLQGVIKDSETGEWRLETGYFPDVD